eukprot:TRINITY_DN57_c0_g1_i1.p1 TRINITY_DN57_c0_g1~~TRINITY_DN57_c0_g1_i1.p1  ORF type:complete len:135 (-),score=27.83 TRINITY_DN57_c0_g1_i1:2778-3182(-)
MKIFIALCIFSFPLLANAVGGFGAVSDPDVAKQITTEALPLLASQFGEASSACKLEVIRAYDVQMQVVAGLNYRFDVDIKSSGCEEEVVKHCTGIQVHQPLPFRCPDFSKDNHCLQLSPRSQIQCTPLSPQSSQ